MKKFKVVSINNAGDKSVLKIAYSYEEAIAIKKQLKQKTSEQIIVQPSSYYE